MITIQDVAILLRENKQLKEIVDYWNYYQELLNSSGFAGITDLLAKYRNLERVNDEWKVLWKPIDELVRPLTLLGGSVGDIVVRLINRKLDGFTEQELEDMWETYYSCFDGESSEWLDKGCDEIFKDGVRIALMGIK
jgi:hypothetical protein